jgi:NAD(P)-dependent dehydrogenase (short-subunit alcohol dehydrogenase family)
MTPTADYPLSDFKFVLDVNVVGAFTVLQAVAKSMRDSGGGDFAIVNTSSVAALRGTPTMVAYVTSKAAVLGMTMAAAKDLAPYKIRVNAVSPALIGPGFMWERQNEMQAASGSPFFSKDPNAIANAKIASVPMKRLGSANEVVATVAFLLSDDASYTTGTNLIVAGGLA